ncbi:hypothetical protein K2173_022799 [Erythroxylum novogranatense]|uniref:DUF4283 domain-containing protein n=1 Tax=Erythroxylum novogranatense TaxID=1862640 RepID=A0AAV8SNN0_9ROSI|nr:hypothetical protein K2173_022799 [Erythroxylum novogranatense]
MTQDWPDEDPVVIEEGDITPVVRTKGGSITLSQNLRTKLDKQWERAVVLKVLGRRVGFSVLSQRLKSLWKLKGRLKMVDLDDEFYLRWSPSFRPSQATISRAVVWIRIPNLPISRYHPQILSAVGDLVGSTVRLDEETLLANRGKFARIAVEIDLLCPLMPSVELDGETLLISYEGLPQVYVRCGVLGHPSNACAKTDPLEMHDPSTTRVGTAGTAGIELRDLEGATGGVQNPAASNGYGPWTHVQRRRPHQAKG